MNTARDLLSLLARVRAHDPVAGNVLARELSGLGFGEARVKLKDMISAQSYARRYAAALCLGAIGDTTAFEALTRATRDEIGMVRRGACRALGELRDQRAVTVLAIATRDVDPLVRAAAAEALARLGAGTKVLRRIGREDPDWRVRRTALKALARVEGTPAIPILEAALEDEAARVRESAVWLLADLGEVEPVFEVLTDDHNPVVRRAAAQALGHSRDERAAYPLLESVAQEGYGLRAFALAALRRVLGVKLEGFLAQALDAEGAQIRRAAVNALVEIGARTQAPHIVRLLDDPDRGVRFAAVGALGELEAAAGIVPLQCLMMHTETDLGLKNAAARALSRIPGAEEFLEQAARDPSPEIRETALAALASRKLKDAD